MGTWHSPRAHQTRAVTTSAILTVIAVFDRLLPRHLCSVSRSFGVEGQHMGSKWFTGGVVAAPRGRIQFDFIFKGTRYRPSIKRPPSEANLRRARERLESIKHQIRLDTFSFEEEFPDYRLLHRLSGASKARLCSEVFDEYLAHCEARLQRQDILAVRCATHVKRKDLSVSKHRSALSPRWQAARTGRNGASMPQ